MMGLDKSAASPKMMAFDSDVMDSNALFLADAFFSDKW